jgi:serine/threonine protein kinase
MQNNTLDLADYVVTDKEIGKGSFSTVYKGYRKDNNQRCAIKCVHKDRLGKKLLKSLSREMNILKEIQHSNIVKLYGIEETHSRVFIIMEYCSLGDLSTYIRSNANQTSIGGLHVDIVLNFFHQISSSLFYLRSKNLIHRDLKPQNILLCKSNQLQPFDSHKPGTSVPLYSKSESSSLPILKLADFGFARELENQDMAQTLCGSPLYMSPEILSYEKYSEKADLWSLGTILFEMLTAKPPFKASNHISLLHKINNTEAILFPDECISPIIQSPLPMNKDNQYCIQMSENMDVEYKYSSSQPSQSVFFGRKSFVISRKTSVSLPSSDRQFDKPFPRYNSSEISDGLRELTRCLLQKDPKQRIDYHELGAKLKVLMGNSSSSSTLSNNESYFTNEHQGNHQFWQSQP